ncbi:hypothetical protein [Francisella uliginis]|uniref:Uncharacterized protein n=1 Tax=Francisella uliginis TaxID=573570 RepID=A0A1L4BSA6_9GAMM|nr:hypothetical protein [Francisella uliginis]API86721.1 hypothetical protein F7310_04810 [Francisella uliginis]
MVKKVLFLCTALFYCVGFSANPTNMQLAHKNNNEGYGIWVSGKGYIGISPTKWFLMKNRTEGAKYKWVYDEVGNRFLGLMYYNVGGKYTLRLVESKSSDNYEINTLSQLWSTYNPNLHTTISINKEGDIFVAISTTEDSNQSLGISEYSVTTHACIWRRNLSAPMQCVDKVNVFKHNDTTTIDQVTVDSIPGDYKSTHSRFFAVAGNMFYNCLYYGEERDPMGTSWQFDCYSETVVKQNDEEKQGALQAITSGGNYSDNEIIVVSSNGYYFINKDDWWNFEEGGVNYPKFNTIMVGSKFLTNSISNDIDCFIKYSELSELVYRNTACGTEFDKIVNINYISNNEGNLVLGTGLQGSIIASPNGGKDWFTGIINTGDVNANFNDSIVSRSHFAAFSGEIGILETDKGDIYLSQDPGNIPNSFWYKAPDPESEYHS